MLTLAAGALTWTLECAQRRNAISEQKPKESPAGLKALLIVVGLVVGVLGFVFESFAMGIGGFALLLVALLAK